MINLSRKTLAVGTAAASLCAFVALGATPASAYWRGGGGWGAPVAAGIIGGAAIGALAAGALGAPAYPYGPPVVYAPPPPCWFQREPVYDYYGRVAGYRRIRVCR